ncbi:MAG: filamentous hemagglutinin N-terminal domain-containing protein [Opitutales bacterium]|nr:filamentous hemagglutinin N-terminal domain-containing protein [Opitutales bacterium]
MKNLKNSLSKNFRIWANRNRKTFRIAKASIFDTSRAILMTLGLFGFIIGAPGAALAASLPTGADIVHGQVELQNTSTDSLRIIQGTQSAIVNWESFDIGHGALVDIVQPNIDAAMLSRVVGSNLSEIHGSLNANGHLYLINPNGIIFGSDAQVDVHALIASSLDLADSAFLSGNISFDGDSETKVMNLGSIKADEFAALIGGDVVNSGSILSDGGAVGLLASGTTFQVGEASGGVISLDISGLLEGTAIQDGLIDASSSNGNGGNVLVTGSDNVIASTKSSTIADGGMVGNGGEIIYFSENSASFEPGAVISAVGGAEGGDGGFIELSGLLNIELSGSHVSTTALNGKTGEFLIDPVDITITSSSTSNLSLDGGTYDSSSTTTFLNVDDLVTALASNNITVTTVNDSYDAPNGGDLTVATSITSSSGNDLTLIASDQLTSSYGANISLTGNLNLTAGPGGIQTIGNIDIGSNTLTSSSGGSAIYVGDVTAGNLSLTTSETGSIIQSTKFKGGELNLVTNDGNVEITASTGDLSVGSISLGSGSATIEATSGTINDAVSDSTIDFVAGSVTLVGTSIGGIQPIDFGTVATVDLTASSGSISSNSAAIAGTSLSASAVSDAITFENSAGALEIASLSSGGSVNLTSSGAITQTGSILNNGQTTTLAAGLSNDIVLSDASNDFGTITVTSGNNVSFRDLSGISLSPITGTQVAGSLTLQTAGGVALALPAITLGEGDNLSITATGAVTDSGSLIVPGTTTISASGLDITLDDSSNNFGAIGVTGANISILDVDAVDLASSVVSGTFGVTSGGAIINSGALAITGASTFTNTDGTDEVITLNNAGNAFTGTVTIATDSGSAVTIVDTTALDLVALSAASLSVTAGGAVTDSGTLAISGATTISASGQDITLSETASTFGTISVIGANVAVTEAAATDLGASTVSGTFGITSTGAITDSGTLAITGASTFTNSGGTDEVITLDDSANVFTGTVTFATDSGSAVTIVDTTALDLVALSAASLNVTAGGAVTDSGTLAISGATTISATGQDITLSDAASTFGTISVTGANVSVTEAAATDLGASTVSGTLGITSTGAVTDSGILAITGVTTISASGQNITLNQAASTFGTLALTGANVAVTENAATDLGANTVSGTFGITSGGSITDSGTQAITGDATFTNTAGTDDAITLDDAGNAFGGTVTFATDSGSAVSIVDTTALDLKALSAASLSATSGGAVTDSGTLAITGATTISASGQDITLSESASTFGTISVTGANVAITEAAATELGASTVSGTLGITSTGAITDSGTLAITGDATFTNSGGTDEAITLDDSGNAFTGSVTFATDSGSAVTIVDTTALDLVALSAASLSVTTGGAVTDSGTLAITGATTISASGQDITLSDTASTFGTISVTGANVAVTENAATDLGASTVSGTFDITSGGAITDSGTQVITGDATFTNTAGTDDAITLDDVSNAFGGTVTFATDSGSAVSIVDTTALDLKALSAASLSATSGGEVTDSGTLAITGATTISASGQDITLDEAASTFGTLELSGANVAVTENAATDLGASTVSGTLSISSGGAVTDSGTLSINGATTISSSGLNITLDQAASSFGTLELTGADVAVTENAATDLGASTVSGTLAITSTGVVTDSGTLTISGATTISASGQDITLDEAASTFGTLALTGANVAVTDAGAVDLGASTVSGTLGVTSAGAVTDSGLLAITGATTINASGQAVSLTNEASTFGDFTVIAEDVYIVESGVFTSTNLTAETVQVSATEGVSVVSTGDGLQLAAQSGTGNIDVVNTGGLVISELTNIQGIQFTDADATGTVSLVAKSPLTINAAIDAKAGEVLLVAAGSDITDDVTINSNVVGASVDVYAGDSIAVTSDATINSSSFELNVGTNYDIATASTSTGSSSAGLTLSNTAGLEKIKIPSIGLITGKGRITEFSSAGITIMDDYLNALNPVLEQNVNLNEIGSISSLDREIYNVFDPADSDAIEIEEKK